MLGTQLENSDLFLDFSDIQPGKFLIQAVFLASETRRKEKPFWLIAHTIAYLVPDYRPAQITPLGKDPPNFFKIGCSQAPISLNPILRTKY